MKYIHVIAILILTGFILNVNAIPLSPESIERLKASGQLEEVLENQARAYRNGVDQPGHSIMETMRQLRRDDPNRDETTLHVPVILVDFRDNEANEDEYPVEHYEELLFSLGELDPGSMREWYRENSYDEVDIIGEVVGWVRLPQTYAYYVDGQHGNGNWPRNSQRMTYDAVMVADDDIDFSDFDNDEDGEVEAVYIVHAGGGAEANDGDEDMIWSHAWALNNNRVRLDGVWINHYSTEPEDGQVGVFGHELGHAMFGLPDVYDRDYSSEGLGDWSMMSGGSWGGGDGSSPAHFDAWCKLQCGFIEPTILDENLEGVEIHPVEEEDDTYILWTGGDFNNEYFLIENRQQISFDESLPGAGLLIYHVDENVEDQNDNEWYPDHQDEGHYLVALEQADGNWDLEQAENRGDEGDPYPGSDENETFDDDSTPGSRDYAGEETGVAVRNIQFDSETAICNLLIENPIPGEPLIYWDFNEGEGRVAHDASGNDLDGTIVSATWNDEGHDGNCLFFDGRNDYVTLDDNDLLTVDEGFMAIAWVYPQYEDNLWHDIMRHHMQTGETEGWLLQTGGNRVLIAMIKMDNECFYSPEGVGPLPRNEWSKVALAWDGEVGEIWLNGRLEIRWETEGDEINSRSDFCVGRLSRNFDRNNHFEGRIDESAFYTYYDQDVLSVGALDRPEIAVEPEALEFEFFGVGDWEARDVITISNRGESVLEYEIELDYLNNDALEILYEPGEGEIEPDEELEITVIVRTARDSEEGNYESELHILSNDPDNDDVVVQIRMSIIYIPHIEVVWPEDYGYPDVLDWNRAFDALELDRDYPLDVEVSNTGHATLFVDAIYIRGDNFSVNNEAFELEPDESRDVTITFRTADRGEFNATCYIASDDPDIWEFQVPLHADISNHAPEVRNEIRDQELDEDFNAFVVADLDEVFRDPDGDEMTFEAESDNENLTVEINENNQLRLEAAENWFGEAAVTITADDGVDDDRDAGPVRSLRQASGSILSSLILHPSSFPHRDLTVEISFEVLVNSVNDPPEFNQVPENIDVEECDLITFTLVAEDVDLELDEDEVLALTMLDDDGISDRGARFTDNWDGSADFAWQTDYDDAGVYIPIFRVADAAGASDIISIRIDVGNVNRAPEQIEDFESVEFDEDDDERLIADLDDYFSDPDDDELHYDFEELDGLTARVSDDNSLFLQPEADWNGEVELIITADDGNGGSVADTILVTVNSINDLSTPFNLISPADNSTSSSYPDVLFAWQTSFDEVEDSTISYDLVLSFNNEEHWYQDIDDTTFRVAREDISIDPNRSTEVIWCVWADDQIDSIVSDQRFHLTVEPLSASKVGDLLPTSLSLGPVYPNPFNDAVAIHFSIPSTVHAVLGIFDTRGRLVITLESGDLAAGYYLNHWNGRNRSGTKVSSGIYICRLVTPAGVRMERLVLLR